MKIRRALQKDIKNIEIMLGEVLNIHAKERPDIFIADKTKYSSAQLKEMIQDDQRPIFVAADDSDEAAGYIFCIMQNYFGSNSRTPIRTLFVDDLCVHSSARGSHIGKALLEYAERYALEKNCYNLTLNVWSFNQRAVRFYENAGLKPMETTMEKILVK